MKPIVNSFHSLAVSMDVLHPNNNSESINIGSEYALKGIGGNIFYLRGGIKGVGIAQANQDDSILPFNSLNFGLVMKNLFRIIGVSALTTHTNL